MGKTETINPRQGAHSRRTTMSRKLALALVAAASLGAMALAPTAASAGWKDGGSGGGSYRLNHYFGPGFGIRYISGGYDRCYVTRRVATPYGYRFRTINVCAY
jgi:hypothetical protein